MSLSIATERAIRTPDALAALVAAVVAADPKTTQEMHWIEWKGSLPLDKREGQFLIAKAILGFANREPRHAATAFEGLAYMVVGAQPGSAPGIAPIDTAHLGQGVRKYADGPQWSANYVDHAGVIVLVVVVEAPRPGDPIHTLAKQYDKFDDGTIFHRGTAQTEPARSREVAMLSRRFAAGVEEPDLDLEVGVLSTSIIRHRLDDKAVAEWCAEHREYLERRRKPEKPPPPPPIEPPPGFTGLAGVGGPAGLGGHSIYAQPHLPDVMGTMWAKPGDAEEFDSRLAKYFDEFRERLPENIIRNLIESSKNKIAFEIVNTTPDPVAGAQLFVTFPSEGVAAFAGAPETRRLPPLPKWPSPIDSFMSGRLETYGEGFQNAEMLSRWDGSVSYRGEIIEIVFDVGDLRPGERYEVNSITLVAWPEAPEDLPVKVSARAMNRRREKVGVFEVPISSETWSVGNWYRATPRDDSEL